MALFGKKSADESQPGGTTKLADHPLFTLKAGMSQAEVVDRIGPPTEARTSADIMAEMAGPDAIIDPSKVEPEDLWTYAATPQGFHTDLFFREQRLVEARVRKDGTEEFVIRIDDQGVAATKNYRLALRAHRLT